MRNSLIWIALLTLLSSCGVDWVPISIDKTLGEQGQNEIAAGGTSGMKVLDPEKHPVAYGKLRSMRDEILNSGKLKHRNDFEWDLHIIKDDSVLNAFCLPGGHIYVFTGLIKYLDNESSLAGVLGHEMAHADCRHSTDQLVKNLGISLLIKVILGFDHGVLVDLGANLLGLSFSRSDETEADLRSVEYLYPTRFDARGASHFFEKIKNDPRNPGIPEFVSTHPDPGNRTEEIIKHWENLGGKEVQDNPENYRELVKDLE